MSYAVRVVYSVNNFIMSDDRGFLKTVIIHLIHGAVGIGILGSVLLEGRSWEWGTDPGQAAQQEAAPAAAQGAGINE